MNEFIILADEFTGIEYSWKKIGVADPNVDNVLTKNVNGYKYERMFDVADVRWWGVKGNGTDESVALNKMLSDIKDNRKVNEVAFYGLEKVVTNSTLNIKRGDLIIDGKNCELSADRHVDIIIFNIEPTKTFVPETDSSGNPVKDENGQDKLKEVMIYYNNINIKNFISLNETTAQTFLRAVSSHYLRITDCRFDGMKLGFDLKDCYFTKINSVYFHSVYQAFKFHNATNAFNVTNLKVHGGGIPSEIFKTTTGGNISGCSFEDASGRLLLDECFGVNISGNYFEGYNEEKVDSYIATVNGNYENVAGINIAGNLFHTGAMQAIKLDKVAGISITGNRIYTLHAVRINGDKSQDIPEFHSTQRNINYTGNSWKYIKSSQVGLPESDSSEFIVDNDHGANISPEWNVPVIFTPQVLHGRYFEDGDHQLAATAIDGLSTANYMTHMWQTNGKKVEAYLNGSVNLLGKHFEPNESVTVDFEPFGFGSTVGTLMIHNSTGEFAMYAWIRNVNSKFKTGYLKKIVDELNVEVVHNEGSITFKNNRAELQYLKAELKV
ncbi:hypothetical protein BBH99_00395 [Chryseobacterium contaminans]|uniref:Right handed beta helix region n=1 Tax=Chryseobacterium contaminans TaxID=1423959 RepID=A0A1M6VQ77_9FLAO|nr:hypothetical protein [Chryseobacterium contaminans]OCA80594.1 hypothetical protein BBH99_00395 [Chryseobacterium contaminans]SHK83609.1 hypothetical protein SAMN05444407_101314 [Chryseobacterium contaminans]